MKLLIVSQYFWPEYFRVNEVAAEMTRRGWQVTVLTGRPNYPDGRIYPAYTASPSRFSRWEGVEVVRVPMAPRGTGKVRLVRNYASFVFWACTVGIWRLRGRPFDAIFMFDTSPITAALPAVLLRRIKRAPLSMWVLDLWPETLAAIGVVRHPAPLGWVGRLVSFIYRRCDRILVQSRAFEPNVARYAGGVERMRYLPAWPETELREGAPARELAPYEDKFRILFTGNIGEAQDFPAILDAVDTLRDVPDIVWLIVGSGRAEAAAREEVRHRGIDDSIVFLGRFPIERMPEFFAGADALLVTLKADPVFALTVPGKLQTYLGAERPIVAMLDGEGAAIVREAECGAAVPAGNGSALAEAMLRLKALPAETRAAMGERAGNYQRQNFDKTRLFDQLERWLRLEA